MNRRKLLSVRSPLWPAIALMTLASPPAGATWNHSQLLAVQAVGSPLVFQRQEGPDQPPTTHIVVRSWSYKSVYQTADCYRWTGSAWGKYSTYWNAPTDVTGDLVVNAPATSLFYINGSARVSRYYWYNDRFLTQELNGAAPQNANRNRAPVIDVAGNHVFYHAGDNTIWMYELQGGTWTCRPMATDPPPPGNVAGDLVYSASGNSVYYRATDGRIHIYWWTGNGWRCDWLTGAPGNAAGDLVVNEASSEVFYRSIGGRIWRYWYDGQAWQGPSALNLSAPANVAGDLLLLPGGNVILYRSNIGLVCMFWRIGSNWQCAPLDSGAPRNVAGSLVWEPATRRVFYRSTTGEIWNYWWDLFWQAAPLNPQAPRSAAYDLVYSNTPEVPASVLYTGNGSDYDFPQRGPIHRLYWQGAAGVPQTGDAPEMADLGAGSVPLPNEWSEGVAGGPVASTTGWDNTLSLTNPVGLAGTDCRIMYEVPNRPARVGLRLYDIQGRLVRTLVDGEEQQGRQVVVWDGRRADGSRASRGILLIRLEADGETRTGKLVVMR